MKKMVSIGFISLVLLTGCWDQRQFKDVKIVQSTAFDAAGDKILDTVAVPAVRRAGEGAGEQTEQIVDAVGTTPRDARDKIDAKLSNFFDPAKIEVVLIGEDLAKKDIYPVLDIYYRNPRSNLTAQLAIVEGKAADALALETDRETLISKYLKGLLESAHVTSHTPGENIQLVCAEMFEEGEDFSLPLLAADHEKGIIQFKGLALFSERAFSGVKLSMEQSVLLMVMEDKLSKYGRVTKKISDKEKEEILNYVTIGIDKVDRKLKIDPVKKKVTIDVKLKAEVLEYPKNHLETEKEVKRLNKKLSELLTKDAEEVISLLKEANSDVFGIGRRTKAYHYKEWKKMDPKKVFKEMDVVPTFTVEITRHGIIN
ncbi:Ger(x)C family spore germination protein [Thalassobacillus hwangdonensis]|uniref:Ger(X)C family spore germination protein n=1 Tax=Thalassobacillus hwangdonensis TaxID=546108 RepID=A0ABW3KVD0_9BACI